MRTALLLALAACEKDPDPTTPITEPTPAVDDLVAAAGSSPLVPSVALVTVEGAPAGPLTVEFGLDGAFDRVTPAFDGPTVPLLGLKAGRSYTWRAVVEADDGRHESAPGTFDVPTAPSGLPELDVLTGDASALLGGYVLLSYVSRSTGKSFLAIFDADADWVWWHEAPGKGIISSEFADDQRSVWVGEYDIDDAIDSANVVRMAIDGTTSEPTRMKQGHHDFAELPSGELAFLSMDFQSYDVPDDDPDVGSVKFGADVILRGAEGLGDADVPTVVYQQFLDHPAMPSFVCSHVEANDDNIGPKLGEPGVLEWNHGNSLVYLPDEDAYYLNARYTDWLLKIDATTGELLWQLGGEGDDFAHDGVLWSHSHLSDLWADGALVFDNGDHYSPPASRIIEVSWDEDAKTAAVEQVFELPGGGFAAALGDARRLPDGNVLGAWGDIGAVTVHTAAGEVAWRAAVGGGGFAARLRFAPDLYELPLED